MSISTSKTRRKFLRICLYLGFALPWLLRDFTKGRTSRNVDPLASSLADLFSNRKSASIIGLEYLRHKPEEADVHLLVEQICLCRARGRGELQKASRERRRELLTLQQRQDFHHSRTVKVHGWILSETEARLCALAALT
jgi:hypothetical protein